MILSKLITANNLEAIAAPEINTKARVRRNEAVFWTVDGAKSDGSEYASAMVAKTGDRGFLQPKPSSSRSVGIPATPPVEGATGLGLSVGSVSWFGCRPVDDRAGVRDVSRQYRCNPAYAFTRILRTS